MKSMRLLLSNLVIASLIFFNYTVYGQNTGVIKGSVTDALTGEFLIGANIFLSDLNIGASSDVEGFYEISKVPAGTHNIIARFVGYQTQTISVTVSGGKTTELNFRLEQTAFQLDELIVSGQGSAIERRKLTSTVESINLREIQIAPVESVDKLLQGRIPGMSALTSSGMPGTSGRVAARGFKSALTNATPVVYVDNVRVDNQDAFRLALDTGGAETSALADLVVGEIDRIEVIKGGAASTLFGSEAANGVIQIFTKKGVPGAPKWSFNVTSGYDEPETKFTVENYVKDNVLRSGFYQSYSAGVMGGTQSFTYNISGKMHENKGIIIEDKTKSKGYNLNAGFRINLKENMNLEISSSYTKSQYSRINNNNSYTSPYGGLEDGSWGDQWGYTDVERDSVLQLMLSPKINDDVDRFRTAINFDYTPIKNFIHKFTLGVDYRKNEERDFVPKKSGEYFGVENGYLYRADREYQTITMSYSGSYTIPTLFGFFENNIVFGAQGFRVEDREASANGEEFSIPGTDDFDNAARIDAQESNRQLFSGGFYLVDQIGLWDKVFLDFGLRVDGNSTFGKDIGLQTYPKAGVAYNISSEDFYPEFLKEYIPSIKLRASWGQTGNFPPPYTRDRTYGANSFLEQSGISFANPGNDELKPEKTTSIDAGIDLGLFRDRASIEFTYFNQNTKDGLFFVPRDPASGFGTQITNVGEIENKGIELSLYAQLIREEDVMFNVRFALATLDNKVVSLGGASPFSLSSFTFLPRRVEEGYPLGIFRVNVPLKDAEGNYTGEYETRLEGNPIPKQYGSFSFDLTLFKNLTISSLTEFAFGQKFVNLKKTLRYFNGTEDAAELVPEGYSFETASSVWVEDGDWIKIREIALSYRIPASLFRGVTLQASIRNVAVLGVDSNNDPELNGYQPDGPPTGGYTFIDLSAPRQFRFGINVNL